MSEKPTLESRNFLEQAAVGIVHATPEGHILRCNAEFADIIGYPREEVRGLLFQQITPESRWNACLKHFSGFGPVPADAVSLEIRLIRKDKNLTWAKVTVSLLRDREGWPSHLSLTSKTSMSRRTVEASAVVTAEALQTSEERYRSAFLSCPDGVLIARVGDGAIIDANPAFLEMMGFNRDEVVGRTSVDLDIWADDGDRHRLAEALQEELDVAIWKFECGGRTERFSGGNCQRLLPILRALPPFFRLFETYPMPRQTKRRSGISLSTTP